MNEVTLPNGWALSALGELVEIVMGQAPPGSACNKVGEGTIFVKAGEFDVERPLIREWTTQPLRHATYGDVLVCVVGATAGKINLGIDCAIGRSVAALRPTDTLEQRYLYYFLSTKVMALRGDSTGSAQGVIAKDDLAQIAIPLPPISEQHRIVAKIEELFSELDKGIENLKTAREQLKVYRQALLKHAFEGKLTAAWRAANPDKLEPAAALLARIQSEREQRYQQQHQQWQTTGGNKPKAPKPLPPLTADELAELPELPEGWGWELIGRFTEVKGGKRLPAGANYCEHTTPHPYIRVVDFESFGVRVSDLKYISPEIQKQISQYTISSADTYISIAGTIGRVGTIPQLLEGANLTENAAKICGNDVVNNKFLSYWLHSVGGASQLVEKTISTTQPKLALFRIEKVAVPVCSIIEQELIVDHLESNLSEIDQLDQTLTTSLQQSEALRQSILKRAFSGLLVAQDPHDEPAAVLLARIRAERATVAAKPRKMVGSK